MAKVCLVTAMPDWLERGFRTSHSFCKLIDTPSCAVAYLDLVPGWSIAKAGGEEGPFADALSGSLNYVSPSELLRRHCVMTVLAGGEFSPRILPHAKPHEPGSDTFMYSLIITPGRRN